jgi:dihydrofolate synthase/folylpolyglutamate synthase
MLIERDFGCVAAVGQWQYWGPRGKRHGLPYPALRGAYQLANAAACLTALDSLHERLPVTAQDIRSGLLNAEIAARFQVLPDRQQMIIEVAHNPRPHARAPQVSRLPKSRARLAFHAERQGHCRRGRGQRSHHIEYRRRRPARATVQQLEAALQRQALLRQ